MLFSELKTVVHFPEATRSWIVLDRQMQDDRVERKACFKQHVAKDLTRTLVYFLLIAVARED